MNYSLIEELIDLPNKLENQEKLNEKNIFQSLETLERILRDVVQLKESIWVDSEMSDFRIFGWCEIKSEWHIALAQRDTFMVPDSNEKIVYGQFPQKILECSQIYQKEVFLKSDLLITEIYRYLTVHYESSKRMEENVISKIEIIDDILNSLVSKKLVQCMGRISPPAIDLVDREIS